MKRVACILSLAVAVVFAGCGGGGGGMAGGGTTGGGTTGSASNGISGSPSALAATFQVDVNSGKVTVVSQKGTLSGSVRSKPGLFTGNSIGFQSSELANDTLGGTGLRVLQVSLVNNTDVTVGVDRTGNVSGLNVFFGAFVNTTGVQDQRQNTHVSTVAGSRAGFQDGTAQDSLFKNPSGTAVGADGSVYVADFGNNRIRKIKTGTVSTFAGSGVSGETDGGPTVAAFSGPYAIAANRLDGSLIVADFNGNKIRRITTTGVVSTIAGTGTAGSANGAGNVATFTNPSGVAVDPSGNIYVSESSSNRIRKIVLSGGSPDLSAHYTVSAFAGNGTAGHVDGAGSSAEFYHPYGLACDSSGNVFAADYANNDVRMVDANANVSTVAGTGTQSDLDGYGNAATFNHPFGIAALNGALFVTDSSGERVREIIPVADAGNGPSNWIVETLAGTGSAGAANGTGDIASFNSPYGIAASAGSSLFVADFGNSLIREVNPSTGTFPIGTIGSATSAEPVQLSNPTGTMDDSDLGTAPYITYPGSLGPGQTSSPLNWNFVIPAGVTSFQFQVMVEANVNALIPLQGTFGAGSPLVDVRTLAGSLVGGHGFQDGPGTTALFNTPVALASDANGVLYVSDYSNSSVRRVDPAGNVTTIAGSTGTFGTADGPGNTAGFKEPSGIAVNAQGTEIFVCDSAANEVRRISLTGSDPTDAGNWYVSTIAGTTTAGFADGPGNTAGFNNTFGVLELSPDELYISEWDGNRIRAIRFGGGDRNNAANWYVSTVAGDNSGLVGASGTTNGKGTNARFFGPEGLCTDGKGFVYVAESQNCDVRKIDTAGNVTTLTGTAGVGYQDGPLATAKFTWLSDIKMDSAGYFYLADANSFVIRRISPSGQVTTVAGVAGSLGEVDGPGNVAKFGKPFGLTISPSGTLYVADQIDGIRAIQTAVSSGSPKRRSR